MDGSHDIENSNLADQALTIAGKVYQSRLLVGSGKYADYEQMQAATAASGAEIVTLALRRQILAEAHKLSLIEVVPPGRYTWLPNTAGCYSAADAIYMLNVARELLDGHRLVKLEVLGDPKTLYPNMPETLKAAEVLVKDGFDVMVYCSDDPVQAKLLEQMGCVAIMPLACLIGSGMGIVNPWNLRLIVEQINVPVIVDAGLGTASDAAMAMELGCDGVLMNSAIARAKDPIRMAHAMKLAVQAGRGAYLAGRIPKRLAGIPTSPTDGLFV
ncbi:thiazole synthase [Ampullimonas aquatilis]|uniref:thiazole synthase n=1 Tax=Ampullimonas aquatilis TaxID=1341549 RepID=UPI003C77FA79